MTREFKSFGGTQPPLSDTKPPHEKGRGTKYPGLFARYRNQTVFIAFNLPLRLTLAAPQTRSSHHGLCGQHRDRGSCPHDPFPNPGVPDRLESQQALHLHSQKPVSQ